MSKMPEISTSKTVIAPESALNTMSVPIAVPITGPNTAPNPGPNAAPETASETASETVSIKEASAPATIPETASETASKQATLPATFLLPISPPRKRQKRSGYTNKQKKWLRDLYTTRTRNEKKPPPYKELISVFQAQFGGEPLGDASIRRWTGKDGQFLDQQMVQEDKQKYRACKWPELEEALYEWQLRKENQRVVLTGAILKEMAGEFFRKLAVVIPHYQNTEFKASTGWFDEYKSRHKVRQRARHGESGKVDRETLEADLVEIRNEIKSWLGDDFSFRDVYNMDETGLFWKAMPSKTLVSQHASTAGTDEDKARITANLCCNADGSHKLPPWFIGKAQVPRAFGRHGVIAENLRMVWRSNRAAWMTGTIFDEYLTWFRKAVHNRRCVLLIDGFSAHRLGIELREAKENGPMQNVKIIFLPANTTSVSQPLDQGIIAAWKTWYRRRWLRYCVAEFDAEPERNPYETMDILKAVQWGVEAWELDVSPETVANCWLKSTCLAPNYRPQTEKEWNREEGRKTLVAVTASEQALNSAKADMIEDIQKLNNNPRVPEELNLKHYDNPLAEQVYDDDDNIVEELVDRYRPEEVGSTENQAVFQRKVSGLEALSAVETVSLYEIQQRDGNVDLVRALEQSRRRIEGRRLRGATQQVAIDSYFV